MSLTYGTILAVRTSTSQNCQHVSPVQFLLTCILLIHHPNFEAAMRNGIFMHGRKEHGSSRRIHRGMAGSNMAQLFHLVLSPGLDPPALPVPETDQLAHVGRSAVDVWGGDSQTRRTASTKTARTIALRGVAADRTGAAAAAGLVAAALLHCRISAACLAKSLRVPILRRLYFDRFGDCSFCVWYCQIFSGRLFLYLFGRLIDWSIDCCLIDRLIDWLIDLFIDWLILADFFCGSSRESSWHLLAHSETFSWQVPALQVPLSILARHHAEDLGNSAFFTMAPKTVEDPRDKFARQLRSRQSFRQEAVQNLAERTVEYGDFGSLIRGPSHGTSPSFQRQTSSSVFGRTSPNRSWSEHANRSLNRSFGSSHSSKSSSPSVMLAAQDWDPLDRTSKKQNVARYRFYIFILLQYYFLHFHFVGQEIDSICGHDALTRLLAQEDQLEKQRCKFHTWISTTLALDWLIDWLIGGFSAWSVLGRLIDWLIFCLIGRWLIDWLIISLPFSCHPLFVVGFFFF